MKGNCCSTKNIKKHPRPDFGLTSRNGAACDCTTSYKSCGSPCGTGVCCLKQCVPVNDPFPPITYPCNPCPSPSPCASPCDVTTVSAQNPTSELVIPELLIEDISAAAHTSVDLTGWSSVNTYSSNLFNNTTGTYTAPSLGDYQFNVVINYETSVPLPVSPTLIDVPSVDVYDVATGDRLSGSTFPVTNSSIPIPPPSSGDPPIEVTDTTILGKAQVVISVIVPLRAGQQVRVRANTNGLTYIGPIVLALVEPELPARIVFAPEYVDTTLTIQRVRNIPRIIV